MQFDALRLVIEPPSSTSWLSGAAVMLVGIVLPFAWKMWTNRREYGLSAGGACLYFHTHTHTCGVVGFLSCIASANADIVCGQRSRQDAVICSMRSCTKDEAAVRAPRKGVQANHVGNERHNKKIFRFGCLRGLLLDLICWVRVQRDAAARCCRGVVRFFRHCRHGVRTGLRRVQHA